MSINRVKAILLQELYITSQAVEVLMDILVFPIMSIVVFGFLSTYLVGATRQAVGHSILIGMILWQVIFIVQYSVSVGSLWNIWSRNLSNLFITPLSVGEYMLAHTLSGILKAIVVFTISALMSKAVFHVNVFEIGVANILLYFFNLMLFAFSMGIIILGLIFRYGTRIQAFAWGLLPLFQPLSASFYPVSVLPQPLQYISYLLPTTYIFEALRASLETPSIQWQFIGISFVENIIYMTIAIWFFNVMFKKSKESGQFARNEA
ncbi:MAG: hypothetical protein RI947_727 [Candidatus Parcubacteria bacterium]